MSAAREMPEQPAVDRAEQQVAGRRLATRGRNLVEQPTQLQSAEIAGQRQPRACAKSILATFGRKVSNQWIDPRVLPDERVVQRLATAPIPHDGSLALISDADRLNISGRQIRARECG